MSPGVGHNGDNKWTANYGPHYPKAFDGIKKNGTDVMFADLTGDGTVLVTGVRLNMLTQLFLPRPSRLPPRQPHNGSYPSLSEYRFRR